MPNDGRMNSIDRFGLFSVLAAAAMLACAGAVTAFDELGVFRVGGITPASRFAALAADHYRPAASTLSKTLLLETCAEAISSTYGRLQRAEARHAVAENCLKQADAITAAAPSLSYGWYVGAMAAARLGDQAGFNARLLRSQITGPAEQWIVEQRAGLVEDNFAVADAEVRTRHDGDLRLLVTSVRGIASISGRYVREPEFRERITAIVETMPEADQARFVTQVRSSAAGP
jgi:hypothetical protein